MIRSDLDIMFLGKTGVGKSRTGNSILNRNAFSIDASMSSHTMKSQRELTVLEDNRRLCVVDMPGVGDTRHSEEQGQQLFMATVREAVLFNPAGYHALIIVLRFGSKFTAEDTKTISYLKIVFGEDFLRKHCIVLITHGDIFQAQKEDGEIKVSFLEWCKQQTGSFRSLLREVQGRILLFNNRGTHQEKLQHRRDLVMMVDRLILGGSRYTDANFAEARRLQEKLFLDHKISKLAMAVQDELSVIMYEKDQVKKKSPNIDFLMIEQRVLMGRLGDLHGKLKREIHLTSDLERLKSVVCDAHGQLAVEQSTLEMEKDLKKKEKAGDMRNVLHMVPELVKNREKSDHLNKKLDQDYKKARDTNNRSWASEIWEAVKTVARGAANVVTRVIIPVAAAFLVRR